MPTSTPVKFGMGFTGSVKGTAASPGLKADIGATARCDFSGAGKMVYDAATSGAQLTVGAGLTTTLDLQSGLTSPLGEAITGAADFAKVYAVFVYHDAASLSSGVEVFGSGANRFQGPKKGATDTDTLGPGMFTGFGMLATKAGWTVDATHKTVSIVNTDGVNAATVRVFIMGTV
jgi:hypothetical protein